MFRDILSEIHRPERNMFSQSVTHIDFHYFLFPAAEGVEPESNRPSENPAEKMKASPAR